MVEIPEYAQEDLLTSRPNSETKVISLEDIAKMAQAMQQLRLTVIHKIIKPVKPDERDPLGR